MQINRLKLIALLVILAGLPARAADDGPALDAAKYPQDTPNKSLASIVKVLEGNDLAYWIKWMIRAEDSKTLLDKYGTIEKAVAKFSESKKFAAWHEGILKEIKPMLVQPPEEGEEDGVKFARFKGTQAVLQLELQKDNRWCMNTKYTGKKKEVEPKK